MVQTADGTGSAPKLSLRVVLVSRVRLFRVAVSQMLTTRLPEASLVMASSHTAIDELATPDDVVLVDSASIPIDNDSRFPPRIHGKLGVLGLDPQDRPAIIRWVAAGATVLLPDSAADDEVVEAVRSAARGEVKCTPSLAEALIRETPRIAEELHHHRPPKLTRREEEIALLIDRGMSNQQIALALSISLSTVKNHVHSILKRLGVRGRAEAAKVARPR
jgi:two-component system nitrate/nitrite response regulator NarL